MSWISVFIICTQSIAVLQTLTEYHDMRAWYEQRTRCATKHVHIQPTMFNY